MLVLLLYGLVRATPDLQRFDHAFLTFLFSWLLWSPLTWYFHTWSITLERLIPEAALLGGAWLSLGRLGLMRKAAGFAALAAAGQYSFPGGIVLWPLLGLLFLREAIQQRAFLALLAYSVSFALSTILFFTGYQHPPHHQPLSAIFEQSPAQIVSFFLIVLGLPFADGPYVAAFLGGANLCLYALGIRRVWRCKQNDAVSWAWTVIGGYALSQALLATVGRLPMGMGHALRPDYITYGIYLLIAGSVLMRRALLASGADRSSHLVLIAGGATLGMAFLHAPSALKQMHARYHRLRADISCLQLMLAFPGERCPIAFYPDPELVLSRARSAHALGVLQFPPVTVIARTDDSLGFVDHHEPSPEGGPLQTPSFLLKTGGTDYQRSCRREKLGRT
ncbi:MAG: hypothetical protein N3A55_06790 [Methylohalobius sp.]|nr:hypothetical protein [Methylohalobius sp.]